MSTKKDFYVTTYCNFAHRMRDGMPIAHECYVLPPKALQLERDGKYEEAHAALIAARPMRISRGVKS